MEINSTILTPTNILIVIELFLLLNYIVFRLGEKILGWLFFRRKQSFLLKTDKLPTQVKKTPEKPLNHQKTQPQINDEGYVDYT